MNKESMQVKEASAIYLPSTEDYGVPPGYMRTEMSILPEDWDYARIDHHACITTGSRNTQDRVENGTYPFFVRSQHVERIDTYSFDGEAVLTAGDGVGTGKVFHYVKGRFDVHQRVYRIGDFSDTLDGRYFFYQFSSRFYNRIMSMTAKSSVDSVRMEMIGGMLIPMPKVPEQRAIAEVLSDVDGRITSLDKLTTKKRAIKQAAMQQLLTGKTRLPGFSGEWERKRLGEMGNFLKGSGVTREQAQSGNCACVRYGEIYTIHNDHIRNFCSWVSADVAATATRLEKGDLLFAGSGETKEEIGKCVAFLHDKEAFAGGDIIILRPRGVDSLFLGYALNTGEVNRQKASLGQGDAVVHISASALAQVSLTLPQIEEQTAIAAVLSDMDAEIAALEARRHKTRALKQGMMQQLLTGRVRLVKPEAAVARVETADRKASARNWQFEEAVIISLLASRFGTEQFPLGRKRYTKLAYLLHRHMEGWADGYLKKAAGPYNPKTRYGGPEKIAVQNGYVKQHTSGNFSGFVAAGSIADALSYFEKWYGEGPVQWLEQFRRKKNDELELLATVDMAAEELRAAGRNVDVQSVKEILKGDPEWKPKLSRAVFSDANITRAVETCRSLFD